MTYDTVETNAGNHRKFYGVARDAEGREVYRTPKSFLSRVTALAKLCEWARCQENADAEQ